MSVSCRRRTDLAIVFPAGATASAETVKSLAAALGVDGDPVAGSPENGMAWQVGPTNGTAPTLTVSALLMSWYSAAWEQPVEAPACMPVTTIPETGTLHDSVVPCPAENAIAVAESAGSARLHGQSSGRGPDGPGGAGFGTNSSARNPRTPPGNLKAIADDLGRRPKHCADGSRPRKSDLLTAQIRSSHPG